MRSLKKVVWSLFAMSAVGLGVLGCSADSGNDATTQPITVLPVPVIDAGAGCPGSFGCACSATEPCTEPKTVCTGQNICLFLIEPCGNCNSHVAKD